MEKRLTRSDNRKLTGVCAGIAEYFDIDPTVVRVIWACGTFFTSIIPGILLYIVLAIIIPQK